MLSTAQKTNARADEGANTLVRDSLKRAVIVKPKVTGVKDVVGVRLLSKLVQGPEVSLHK
jgi:hypothetical protein